MKNESINIYGNLATEKIKFLYNELTNLFEFQVGEKPVISLDVLNEQLNIQGVSEDSYTIDNIGNLKNIIQSTLISAKAKKTSIDRYGNLIAKLKNAKIPIKFFYQEPLEKYTIIFNDLDYKKNWWLDKFFHELRKQNIGVEYNIDFLIEEQQKQTINFDLIDNPLKAKSIKTYGNLKERIIEYDLLNDEHIFQIENKKIMTWTQFNEQLNNQGDTEEEDYTIDNIFLAHPFDETTLLKIDQKKIKKKRKKNSKKIYGSLKNGIIEVDYDGNNYTFQVGKKKLIVSLKELNIEFNKQNERNLDLSTIELIESSGLYFNGIEEAKAKKASFDTYGNLKIDSIEVDYEENDYTFQVDNKTKLNLLELNDQLNIQGDIEEDYTIDNFGSLNIDETTLTNAKAKAFFDLTNVQNTSNFNKANQTTIDSITIEINKINNYDSLTDEVKAIVDHDDNSDLKILLKTRLQDLQTKKANLELAKNYFDLTNVQIASNFNNADQTIINLVDQEILKINDYVDLSENVKTIVNHNDNSEYKNTLNTRLEELTTKKTNLELAQIYFDLTNVQIASNFNKANDVTINLIDQEIEKINNYDCLPEEIKTVVDHDDNSNLKNFLQIRLQELQTKKTDLKEAKNYFDLNIESATEFTKIITIKTDLIIDKISKDNYNFLTEGAKKIVDHDINSDLKNVLINKFEAFKTKMKSFVEKAKIYFDLTDVQNASFFNKADDETINLINQEIEKINDYDDLSEDVRAIVDNDDNSDLKILLQTRLHELKTKKTNLESAQTYFDLTEVLVSSNFNKADDQTIDLITDEINKINDYDDLSEDVKAIVDHDDNSKFKNLLQTKLQNLQSKEVNLELAKTYFDLTEVLVSSNFNKADDQTIDLITDEINKINDYDDLSEDVKAIVDHDDNSKFKNLLQTKLQNLQSKEVNLELAKTYFDLTNVQIASNFNKADQTTIDLINQEIEKINNYDDLLEDVKAIVDHNDNLEYKNALQTRLQELEEKKANLESVKTYFDLTGVQNPSIFNKADQTTIDLITSEINKINDYDNLSEEIKAIFDHDDNLVLKNSLNTRLHELQTKKANLELAQTYFNHQKSTFFNKANNQTIDLINQEINKILNDYDNFSEDVKAIIDHSENLEFKNELQELETKIANLELAKGYFDLTDVQNASFFNKADDETINLINQEIEKINDYDDLSEDVRAIVDNDDNSDLKILLQTRLHELQTKKTNLELAKTYLNLKIKEASTLTEINLITDEINKDNYNTLTDEVKAIVNHDDNSDLKSALTNKFEALKTKKIKFINKFNAFQEKKRNLELAKNYFDLTNVQNASFFNKADDETINLINKEINKINDYDDLSEEVKAIVDHDDNSKFKKALESRKWKLKIKIKNIESAKTYLNLEIKEASTFTKSNTETINLINEEIKKNNYNFLTPGAKAIVDHDDNSEYKNALNTRLQVLEEKKANLLLSQIYFDLNEVQSSTIFNKVDDQTINSITIEINKINDYDDLSKEVKAIVDHSDNLEYKNALITRLQELISKKTNLELAKIYFDLTDVQNASNFNKADDQTIDLITDEINKINDYDDLLEDVKTIVDYSGNSEYKNVLNTRLHELQTKKANLESAKAYFDLVIKPATTFTKAIKTEIDLITTEIDQGNYGNLNDEVKAIIDHVDNSLLKSNFDQKIEDLKTKKTNLELAKTYFDLTNVQDASNFNKADTATINSISDEINKGKYNDFSNEVKEIIDHDDNSDLKNALNIKLQELETKKTNLESAKTYFDLVIKPATTFTKAIKTEIDLITTEIDQGNYGNLNDEVKAIIDHVDNSLLKSNFDQKIEELKTKKTNLELAKAYFDLDILEASTFTEANTETIESIQDEIDKKNYDDLTPGVKAIVNYDDNSDLKNAIDQKIADLKIKKRNLELAKTYFDLDIKEASTFTKAKVAEIDLITDEINKKNFDSLPGQIKAIVNHDDNSELKGALNEKIKALETKKTHLIEAKAYFDLDILEASTFTEANTETINSIQDEIDKKNYDDLTPGVKAIVNYDDNSDLKNAIDQKIANLKIKKRNLELAKTYFDLDIKEASTFTKAKVTEIDLITTEIDQDNYGNLNDEVKAIIDHVDNSLLKSNFDQKIEELKTKKTNLELAKAYFDLVIKEASTFTEANTETINSIQDEIDKENYEISSPGVKAIVNYDDNSDLKNAIDQKIADLKIKKRNLELAKTYFDLINVQDASNFNKADTATINSISDEINKGKYNDFSNEVKEIIDHDDNSDLKNALNTRLQELETKKTNLESAKTYFDLVIKPATTFTKAIKTEIDLITTEIDQGNYGNLNDEVKAIIDHVDNSLLKSNFDQKIEDLKTKKTNLELAKAYFDLNIESETTFTKAYTVTINSISDEINKGKYNDFSNEVKEIIDHDDNSDLKNALNEKIKALETKKTHLTEAKAYFDLVIKGASTFTEANTETINSIQDEIDKENYEISSPGVKAIINYDDNSDLKNAIDQKIADLKIKKRNLELAKTYFDLDIKEASTFTKAKVAEIDLITTEIDQDNYGNLNDEVKAIIDHVDNSLLKSNFDQKIEELKTKKTNLELAKAYFDLNILEASTFTEANTETIESIQDEIDKKNYDDLTPGVKAIINYDDNSDLKNAIDQKIADLKIKKRNLELAKTYFDLDIKEASTFTKAKVTEIDLITTEIDQDNYGNLNDEVKAIIDHVDNSLLKSNFDQKIEELKTKKTNLELAKAYFDLDILEASTFTEANTETINSIQDEIDKENYEISSPGVKAIVNYDDNSDLKNAIDQKIADLKIKKRNLELAKTYFDLDIKEASTFTKAKVAEIDLITDEINKKNFDSLPGQIKAIVNYDDNSELKGALNEKIKALETKKTHLIEAKAYFDLDILEASTFTKANTETIESIQNEINKKNFDSLPGQIKAIVNHDDNSELKGALNEKIKALETKKTNLESAKAYFDLDILEASTFTKANTETIESIQTEINKKDYDDLTPGAKAIVNHIDNLTLKSDFDEKIEALKTKKTDLTETKTKLDSIEKYGDLRSKLFVSYDNEEYKFNVNGKEKNKLNFEDLKVEYNKQTDTLINEDLTIENIDLILKNIDQPTLLKAQTKANKNTDQKPKIIIGKLIESNDKIPAFLDIAPIIGIFFGVIVLISVILVCFWKIFKKKTKNKKNEH